MNETNPRTGRPRSEDARQKVLWAVDDLLQEVGYAALTVKGIAEHAGVGRQTVYRWWSTKAEILLEACMEDAQEELTIARTGDRLADLTAYLDALVRFLADSSAGAAYRAVISAAQHDPAVAKLVAGQDVLGASARAVLGDEGQDQTVARLIGPVFFWVLSGRDPKDLDTHALAQELLD